MAVGAVAGGVVEHVEVGGGDEELPVVARRLFLLVDDEPLGVAGERVEAELERSVGGHSAAEEQAESGGRRAWRDAEPDEEAAARHPGALSLAGGGGWVAPPAGPRCTSRPLVSEQMGLVEPIRNEAHEQRASDVTVKKMYSPSVPNYKSLQEFWRAKSSQSLTKIIERNIKSYDIE